MKRPLPTPSHCANCGAEIPAKSAACPECGADERMGWREQDIYDGLDLPDEETPEKSKRRKSNTIWIFTAILLVALMAILVLRGHW